MALNQSFLVFLRSLCGLCYKKMHGQINVCLEQIITIKKKNLVKLVYEKIYKTLNFFRGMILFTK